MSDVVPKHDPCVCVSTETETVGVGVGNKTQTTGRRPVSLNTHTRFNWNLSHTLHCYGTKVVPNVLVSSNVWYQSGTTLSGVCV